jgi:hypothetical protein
MTELSILRHSIVQSIKDYGTSIQELKEKFKSDSINGVTSKIIVDEFSGLFEKFALPFKDVLRDNFEKVPNDITFIIFSFCEISDLANLNMTNKKFKNLLLCCSEIWKAKFVNWVHCQLVTIRNDIIDLDIDIWNENLGRNIGYFLELENFITESIISCTRCDWQWLARSTLCRDPRNKFGYRIDVHMTEPLEEPIYIFIGQ